MSHWQKIREEASRLRREICAASGFEYRTLIYPETLIDSALEHLELDFSPEHPDSANLYKSLAVLEDGVIYFNNHLPRWFKNYCIAHEIGHFVLHETSTHCSEDDLEDFSDAEESISAVKHVKGYGARERREREANLFALEFLLPCDVLREIFLDEKLNAQAIGKIAGLPSEVVAGQLARAILTPQTHQEEKEAKEFDLDESQKVAAETDRCPVLIAAGPGTGKTQTLIKRILFLLARGTPAHKILALTFSNRATEEMRERIAAVRPNEAKQMKIMTFHSFGLDILRRFYEEAGLNNDSELLDKIDALLFLEKNLLSINLEHYQSLHEPTQNLPAILSAISRAKDELITPARYLLLAEKMAAEAESDEDKEKASKAVETARVYEFYQNHLDREKLLDFGDLIFRAVTLLKENESIRLSLRSEFDAILVDEFQDVNRACGVLLKEIAGNGDSLWVVGDLRQSIYRWRGASPANIRLFAEDFPDARTLSLENNYRSKGEIIKIFGEFAKQMRAASANVFCSWRANRDEDSADSSAVSVELSDSLDTEAETLANNILGYHENGIAYKEQAVICRTHNQLNSFAEALSKKGIPIFYLGELFEREEICDLLALLDLRHSQHGHSLVRVGNFPEYNLPLADIQVILDFVREQDVMFFDVLETGEIAEKLSPAGRDGWEKLSTHLRKLIKDDVSAWKFLSEYLFNHSQYLRYLISDKDIQKEQKLLALYQFLNFAGSMESRFAAFGKEQVPEFLRYVKKLAWFGEDKNFSQIPSVAENLDAVRLLTVHSAKGLEFHAVYLPYLGAGKIPSNRKGQICPPPLGMLAAAEDYHDEEEECLFFVAMSRARDHLHLSRSLVYGSGNSNESKFLSVLAKNLPAAKHFESASTSQVSGVENPVQSNAGQIFYSGDMDRYMRCPRDYYYTNILGLKAKSDASIYLKFHSCVYDTIHSLQTIRQLEHLEVTEETALSRLREFWREANMDEHAYSPIYKKKAEQIVRVMCAKIARSRNEILRKSFEIRLENGTIRVRPDAIEIYEDAGEKHVAIRRYRTGKSPKEVKVDDIDALMLEAVQRRYPEAKSLIQKIYLTDNVAKDVSVSKKILANRLKKYQEAIDGIMANQFPAEPGEDNCPHCPHFFICPSGEHNR
jgi:DNA helicase-2/ATP-dependent DNA helicase PcrA